MTRAHFDLADVTLVNESAQEDAPGDVTLFRTTADACAHLEPWWVDDEEGFVINGAGQRILLGHENGRVVPRLRLDAPGGPGLVAAWLQAAVADVRRVRGDGGPASDDIADLIEYIGFQG